MAVLPTPGSPMSTGLFLVRRDSTWMTPADLVVAADDRIELALAGRLGEIAAVLLERLVLLLGVLAGDPVADPRTSRSAASSSSRCDAEPVGQREQQVLGRQVLVAQLVALGVGARRARSLSSRPRRDSPPYALGSSATASSAALRSTSGAMPTFCEDRQHDALVLAQQGGEQVVGGDLGVAVRLRRVDRGGEGLLGLEGPAVRDRVP